MGDDGEARQASPSGRSPGPVVVEPEERDRSVHVVGPTNPQADPSRFRKNVMQFGAAGGNDFLANRYGERQVGQTIAVEMAELAAPYTEFDPAKPMRRDGDAVP